MTRLYSRSALSCLQTCICSTVPTSNDAAQQACATGQQKQLHMAALLAVAGLLVLTQPDPTQLHTLLSCICTPAVHEQAQNLTCGGA